MNYELPIILMIIAIIGLIVTVPLLIYYGSNIILEVFFWLSIVVGIIACCIWIAYRTPNLEKLKDKQTTTYTTYEVYDNNLNTPLYTPIDTPKRVITPKPTLQNNLGVDVTDTSYEL